MIATTLIRRSAPRLAKEFLARQGGVVASQLLNLPSSAPTVNYRSFSSLDPSAFVPPTTVNVTNKVRVLNIDVVKNILKELNSVDKNQDGR